MIYRKCSLAREVQGTHAMDIAQLKESQIEAEMRLVMCLVSGKNRQGWLCEGHLMSVQPQQTQRWKRSCLVCKWTVCNSLNLWRESIVALKYQQQLLNSYVTTLRLNSRSVRITPSQHLSTFSMPNILCLSACCAVFIRDLFLKTLGAESCCKLCLTSFFVVFFCLCPLLHFTLAL